MMKQMLKHALLFTLLGSVVFLLSCNEDEDPSVDPPVAGFTFVIDGATVTFANTSTGDGNSYSWDFGDGNSSTSSQTTFDKAYLNAGTYTVTLTATNESGTDDFTSDVVIETGTVDTEAPVITLSGTLGSDFDIELGSDFTDPGATATDNVDGDVNVTVGGDQVNTEEAGTYVITYDAVDATGNVADQVTRTVRVRFPGGLIVNSDFQGTSTAPWFVNFGDLTVPVQTVGTNTFFIVNIETSTPDQPFNVNLSQVVAIEQGKTYKLSFNASSDVSRSIIAGIGLNGGSYAANSESVGITDVETRYELQLKATFGEGGVDNRVLFDLAGETGVVVLDNIKLEEIEVTTPAPTDAPSTPPTRDAADVISIYGDAYGTAIGLTNVSWDDPTNFTEESIAGNNVLKIDMGGGFMGSTLGSVVDASSMTHFHMDFWIASDFAAGQIFNPKWSNHAGGAGETSAFEYTKAIGGSEVQTWVSLDVAISDFATGDNSQRANLTEFLISVAGLIDVAYVDNIYFYNAGDGGGGGGGSVVPSDAPTTPPTRDAADVISIYGDAYGTAIGLNNVEWDEGSEATEETHAGNNVLKLSFQTFLGTDLGSEVDASGMTHVHIDFWIADDFNAGQVFLPKWSNHNGAEETDAFEYTFAVGGTDSKKWLSIDVPIVNWANVRGSGPDARANLKQLVIGVSGTLDVVYMDNVYFYKN